MVTALYIHIPFCAAKCSYCSFNSYAGLEGLQSKYVDSLCAELKKMASEGDIGPLRTIFMGGGTPTLLHGSLLDTVLSSCFALFSVAPDAEISIEANPGTVDREKLDLLRKLGVNRISLGVQSFNDQELARIGRIHSGTEATRAVHMARAAGFNNLSIDLMYGLPGQNPGSWQTSLETGISLGLNHLSLYQLTVEEGTPLERMVREDRLQLPDDDEVAVMDAISAELTAAAGLFQYEISNYAQPEYQCRHNITYWENREYMGVGSGAVSCLNGCRRRNIADPEQYCRLLEAGESVIIEEETLESDASFRESVIMGLRLNKGVSVGQLENRYGLLPEKYYGDLFKQLVADGLLEQRSGYLRLTARGRVFANQVMAELV
ncbi:MAG: radical SAM family heme chaperone HemW [Proteobacteria bacterium]|nr:radical SAM family heme chaperone HemW [Pseudomonadota bacterium]MBU1137428.1 radical SAM family heme chaperone HemW [Pseudomonadota bacterium]